MTARLPLPAATPPDAAAAYRRLVARKRAVLVAALTVLTLLLVADIALGPAWLTIGTVLDALFAPARIDERSYTIVWAMRMPIALTALLIGAALGIAGAQMQTILDNPMADPYTLGISAAAGFGASLVIATGKRLIDLPAVGGVAMLSIVIPVSAFVFAFTSALLIYFVARLKRGAIETVVLAGIALHFLFGALTQILHYFASESALQGMLLWSIGSLSGATWWIVALAAGVLVLVVPILVTDAWKLTALRLGDAKARSMGVDAGRLRLKVLLLVSLIAATAVCFVGTIGFIGLAAPHVARALVGEDQRFFMPTSALAGAGVLSFASIASKLVVPGQLIDVGIVTSIIGIPFLLAIALRRHGGMR